MNATSSALAIELDASSDTAATEEFYRRHRAKAVRWATALVGCPEVGADLGHDALIAVAERLDRIDEPVAYLRRCVMNRVSTWRRWHVRERQRLLGFEERTTASAWPAETTEMLSLLHRLPYRQRAALTMRYWAGWSDAEIAEAIDCAPSTVRVLVFRGLTTLRKELTDG